jgi:hypothetical protein
MQEVDIPRPPHRLFPASIFVGHEESLIHDYCDKVLPCTTKNVSLSRIAVNLLNARLLEYSIQTIYL